jgi:hypothetical protein
MGDNSESAPLSEQYRIAAEYWAEMDSAASLLEETKSAVLAQMMAKLVDIPVTHAERQVKASKEWLDHVTKIVKAREKANIAYVHREYAKMKFNEWNNHEANARAERRM